MSSGRVGWSSALVLAGCLVGCRVYRDQPDPHEAREAGEASPRTPDSPAEAPGEREAVAAQRPAADALNLWVLNRPKGELVPQGADGAERAVAERAAAEQPKPTIIVVLGVGDAAACSEWYARRAIDALAAGVAPLRVVASVLDSGRRWRWTDAEGTVSAMVRSSAGVFGGVQAASPSSFSAWALEAASERHVLIDGRNPRAISSLSRARRAPEGPASIPSCDIASAPALGGPLGILIRSASGDYFGGVVSLDLPADAGVVSVVADYGVSLAVGPRGGVLMVSDCALLPPGRVAERVYASPNWASSTAQPNEPGRCGIGHALLTADQAWVTTGSPLSGAVAQMEARPPSAAPDGAVDAGSHVPGATVPP